MKRLLCVLFIVSTAVTQGEAQATDCEPQAVVASFADAVAGETLAEWVRASVTSECDTSIRLLMVELTSIYLRMDGVRIESGIVRQWASDASATSSYGREDYGAMRATGEPDSEGCADSVDAWTTRLANERAELILTFDQPVIPTAINIYQNYNPGSITRVSLINAETGDVISIPNSTDIAGVGQCPHTFTITPMLDSTINGVVITLDQSIGGSWNEIDAVELIGISI